MQSICHIVCAGDFSPELLCVNKGDLILAADAGLRHLEKTNVQPDLFIGDGDSLGLLPDGIQTVVLPKEKDDTDSLAALRYALSLGYRLFHLYGALGGKRFSHSLANLQSLSFLHQNKAKGILIDPHCRVEFFPPNTYKRDLSDGYFSLFSMEGEACVSVRGAKYPLDMAILTPHFPLGISNEGGADTEITIHRGSVFFVREI